jgi:electron transfer flavoprotein alpha subunit
MCWWPATTQRPLLTAAAHIAGVAKVLHADEAGLAHGLAENVAAQVLALAAGYTHILFPATAGGKNVAPRVAARLDVGQVSDITRVDSPDTFERPIYAGNAMATVQATDAVKVITVRTTGFDPAARPRGLGHRGSGQCPGRRVARAAMWAARLPRTIALS